MVTIRRRARLVSKLFRLSTIVLVGGWQLPAQAGAFTSLALKTLQGIDRILEIVPPVGFPFLAL
jgi:hypothetical protein